VRRDLVRLLAQRVAQIARHLFGLAGLRHALATDRAGGIVDVDQARIIGCDREREAPGQRALAALALGIRQAHRGLQPSQVRDRVRELPLPMVRVAALARSGRDRRRGGLGLGRRARVRARARL
jgi:hypothetical protein